MLISSCVAALKHIRHLFSSGMADSTVEMNVMKEEIYTHKPRNRRPSMPQGRQEAEMERAGKGQSPYCGLGGKEGAESAQDRKV